ncbi:type III-B CRISPR module-associated Cmr3 family protein [Desulfotomaculum copahuensis]|uniref:CRISPR-associated RAMP protein Csx10 n=1 Tax=Desulfotomaculum copahuensis TaxID=1838280 RepID=A0A1B7LJL6_9FIRM|nr:type III-B CRISPR module-associated Cmr3 family protein [Desulfotomaculum copahuensis]OAT86754.1 hypothetical protein A6M21_02765 [Desulfotomaculum copahuensis]
MLAYTFTITLLEPLLVTRMGAGDPNSAVSFNFIPGSVLRGALINRYIRREKRGGKVDAAESQFRRMFFNETVCILNAYPVTGRGGRSLPTPFSWHAEKDTEEPAFDFAVKDVTDQAVVWKHVDKPFCDVEETGANELCAEFYQPDWHLSLHIDRGDRQRVNRPGTSNVFRYQALAPGERYRAAIVFTKELPAAEAGSFKNEFERLVFRGAEFSLGGSHLAGYGRVEIGDASWEDHWREYDPVGEDTGEVVVTLLSDALVRDGKTGNWAADLEPALHVPGQEKLRAFKRTRIVGGFNRTWNLPLPQSMAIQAGSVFIYRYSKELMDRLKKLVVTGIGERRVEGFGRLAVNWHRTEEITVRGKAAEDQSPRYVLGEDDGEARFLAEIMVKRMLRAKLDEYLAGAIQRIAIKSLPNRSQVSRLRTVLRQAIGEKKIEPLLDHLEKMKKTASIQFSRAVVQDGLLEQTLAKWVKEMAGNLDGMWDILGVEKKKLPSVGGLKPELTPELALEYTVRLIDGVLGKAVKEERSRAGSQM